jgi:hypothetical protein
MRPMPFEGWNSASIDWGRSRSSVVNIISGVPAAQACGREAVGKATGTEVIERGNPAKTSGRRCSKKGAAPSTAAAIVPAAWWCP